MAMGFGVLASGGVFAHVGIGGGRFSIGWDAAPRNTTYLTSSAWELQDMRDVIALGASGRLRLPATHYALEDIEKASMTSHPGTYPAGR
jgi:hypothetical protein